MAELIGSTAKCKELFTELIHIFGVDGSLKSANLMRYFLANYSTLLPLIKIILF